MSAKKLAIIGSGPAGYAAAIYTARAQLTPVVYAGVKGGGQLMLTTEVENYPGWEIGKMGPELMLGMRKQAERFGAEIIDHDVVRVDLSVRPFRIWAGHHLHKEPEAGHIHPEPMTQDMIPDHRMVRDDRTHEDYDTAQAVIITTGAESVPLGIPGEADYIGRGVSYCAVCDAAFFKGKRVFVAGGGDAAMEDTLALTKFASKVTIIHRREAFRASKIMQERVLSKKNLVDVLWNSEVTEVLGNREKVIGIKITNKQTGKIQERAADGVFVAIGHKPATEFLGGQIDLDEKGYVKTGLNYPQDSWLTGYPTMTSVPGVFAAGDNVDFRYKQAATAAGMGVMAALDAEKWLEEDSI